MTKLLLLDDVPAGRFEPASVAFNHALYADLLRDVLLDNRPGICVGFFARWGQGKSTVVNLLESLLGDKAQLIVFNAYQARGDSVRRQMLLSILRQIDPAQAEEFERFTQVVTPLELQTADVQNRYSDRNLVTLLLKSRADIPLMLAGAGTAISAGLMVWFAGAVLFTSAVYEDKQQHIVAALAAAFVCFAGFVVRWLHGQKDKILAYTQPVSDSQRLKYPEQFSRVFREAVHKFNQNTGQRLVLVVDDLDRCDPATVIEALACVRHFCHAEQPSALNCQFLMPCDEKQMVCAMEHNYHDYSKTEMLRKFFDVVVRMDEIVPESLAKYAAQQAKLIGVDQLMARDIVDAGGVREPRKVKALLNAYRLASEAVMRNEKAGMLPPADQMELLEPTLATLVCLQELAPNTFEAIRGNPDPLNEPSLGGDTEPVARRIVAGLGPVSVATADLLITKQYEPSLRGLSVAHSLSSADRGGRVADVVQLIAEASPADREQMLAWLAQKLREARSGARIKVLLSYLLDLGIQIGWGHDGFKTFLHDLRRWKPLLQDALRVGDRLKSFGDLMETIDDRERYFFDAMILKNYLAAVDLHPAEERYLLRFANRLSGQEIDEFRRGLEHGIFPAPAPNAERLKALSQNIIALDEKVATGLAIDLGERLFNGLTHNHIGASLHDAALVVGLRFIGGDKGAVTRLLRNLLTNAGIMQNPTDLTVEYVRDHGIYFRLLQGLLAASTALEGFPDYFRKLYWKWLIAQSSSHGRENIIEFLQPGWGLLPGKELARIGQHLVSWIWDDGPFAKVAVALIDEPERKDPSWIAGRNELRARVFQQFCEHIRGHSSLPQGPRDFLAAAHKAGWPMAEFAEELLADKIRRVANNEGGRPDNLREWQTALCPLCLNGFSRVQKEVGIGLAKAGRSLDLIAFALEVLWQNGIPGDVAPALADAILREPKSVFASPGLGEQLPKSVGFAEVARVIFKHLPARGVQWMHNNPAFMKIMSSWAASEPDASRRFQEGAVDALLTGGSAEHPIQGLELLEGHSHITMDVQRSLLGWATRADKDEALKNRIAEAAKRPTFNDPSLA